MQVINAILNQMFEKEMHLVSFETKLKMAIFNLKFVNVVELFIQHMSYLCIDCSKINNLGVSINVCKPLLSIFSPTRIL